MDCFLPVARDADRIVTGFHKYERDAVVVHDLVHLRDAAGWRLLTGAYRQLRLSALWVEEQLRTRGLVNVRRTVRDGLTVLSARKRPVLASGNPAQRRPGRSATPQSVQTND